MKFNELKCHACGQQFEDIFEVVDHLLEDNEPTFDPKLILPNGYSLMVGTLLRTLFQAADDPERVKHITQSTYATLFTAENSPNEMRGMVEDIVAYEQMIDIDNEYKELLDEGK